MNIGFDLTEIERIRKALQNPRFFERVYSDAEREMLSQKRDPAPSAAANFAAKEAFVKALGTGFRDIRFHDIEILRDPLGKPYIRLGEAFSTVTVLDVSLTHTETTAGAVVLLERHREV